MKFEYDENGAKFVYFVLAFYAMIIIPCTYFFWPRKALKKIDHAEDLSLFEPCMKKIQILNAKAPKKSLNDRLIKAAFVLFWAILFFMAFKASQIKTEHKEYDPYVVLRIERGVTDKEIRKQYRELSKIMHPDRGGDEEEFKELTKAYKSLTDEETKKNWLEYGNPDGPGATEFGIALPKWIVDGKNSYIVLGVYVLVFMIIMPTVVGMWWYKSIKYTGDQILMRTTQLYYHFLMKTPNLILKRVIMVLGSSFEYEKSNNPEIIERPSDNVEMPALMRDLTDLQEKIREFPFCHPYSVKARSLIHAHLLRMDLPPDTLDKDRNIIVKKAPFLLNELVNVVSNLVATASSPNAPKFHPPQLETVENIMKLSPMIVQAMWDKNKKHSLLQLPYLNEGHLRHFVTKKRNIYDIKQFVQMEDCDRRSILRHLTNEQYEDIMRVCSSYPLIDMTVNTKIFDDEDEQIITAGAIVTVAVNLRRQNLSVLFEKNQSSEYVEVDEEDDKNEVEELGSTETQKNPPPANNKKSNNGKNQKYQKKQPAKKPAVKSTETKSVDKVEKIEKAEKNSDSEDEGSNQGSNDEANSTNTKSSDDYFEKFQQIQKKKESLDTKSTISHRVFCPYFPEVKQEYWWLYVADRKKKLIISAPIQICSLKDTEEIDLKFLAPGVPGTYTYTVILKSDSYIDFDIIHNFKLEVQPAKKIEEHPQWNFTDEEDAEQNDEDDSEFNTESESDAD